MIEYLLGLQVRQKWCETYARPNLKSGDLVLLVDENSPRGQWSLGRVLEATCGSDGLRQVRNCRIQTRGRPSVKTHHQACILGRLFLPIE